MNKLRIRKGLRVKMRPLKNIRRSYYTRNDMWNYRDTYASGDDKYLKLVGRNGVVVSDVWDSWDSVQVKFEGIGKPVFVEYFEIAPAVKILDLKEIYDVQD